MDVPNDFYEQREFHGSTYYFLESAIFFCQNIEKGFPELFSASKKTQLPRKPNKNDVFKR